MVTNSDRLPLECEGLELLSDEGLDELHEYVEREILRRRVHAETSK
jgi:hypothetical protein